MSIPEIKSDTFKSGEKKAEIRPVIDTILNEGSVIIYGDTTIQKDKIKEVLIKFEPYITFDDFKVSIENVKAKLDLNSHDLGKQFRTAIRESYNDNENLFAGHYIFATWGCGSPCQMNVLIDRRTGKIYDAPDSSVGSEFKKDSRMLIINPPEEGNYYYNGCIYCKPEIYILNEITKKFEKKEPYKI
ncbi:hypothetical protein L1S34_13810 [Flavobacterium sp. K77]|uniref:hypothetical protein n=1 Tax=Flavobacterium sp. K77 TaxID=2910676 RepID=UPI001F38218C|nr:hypothetical protein [Flavobacterium sp. K77]MCF6142368.1 hypothetical protein [Flavobacterium sp. K77]